MLTICWCWCLFVWIFKANFGSWLLLRFYLKSSTNFFRAILHIYFFCFHIHEDNKQDELPKCKGIWHLAVDHIRGFIYWISDVTSVSGKFLTFEKVRETMRILFCVLLRLCRNLMPEFNAHPVLSHLGTSAFTFGTSTFRPVFLHNFISGSNSPMVNKKHATAKKLCNAKLVRKTIY